MPKSRLSCLAFTYWASRLMSQCGVGLNLKFSDWSWTMLSSLHLASVQRLLHAARATRSPSLPHHSAAPAAPRQRDVAALENAIIVILIVREGLPVIG